MLQAKICGLSDERTLDAALSGGARYAGFVFFPKSPRDLADLAKARALANRARGRAEIVAVAVNPDDNLLRSLRDAVRPDWIQLHGEESPARAAEVRALTNANILKALPIATAADLAAARDYEPVADAFLFDAKAPAGAERPGGLGAAFDWRILQGRTFARPWFLSGGLTPQNVAEAARVSGARLVDASSGLETAPGLKDPALIHAFLNALRSPSPRGEGAGGGAEQHRDALQ